MTQDLFLLFGKITIFVTAAIYVAMMVLYFQNGPKHNAERLMSVAMLFVVALHATILYKLQQASLTTLILPFALVCISNILFWSARVAHNKHGKTRPAAVFGGAVPENIVRSGPYRFVRHPFYLSYILVFFATALLSNIWWLYLSSAIIFALYNLAADQEEKMLSESLTIGTEYTRYCQHSWRWCPKVW